MAKLKAHAHPTQSPRPEAMRWKIANAMLVTQGTQAHARNALPINIKMHWVAQRALDVLQIQTPLQGAPMSLSAQPTPGTTLRGGLQNRVQRTQTPSSEAPPPPTASVTWATRDRTAALVQHVLPANTRMLRARMPAQIVRSTLTPMSGALYRVIALVISATQAQMEELVQPVPLGSIKIARDPPYVSFVPKTRIRIQQALRCKPVYVSKAFQDQTGDPAFPVLQARSKMPWDLQIVQTAPTTAIPLPKVPP